MRFKHSHKVIRIRALAFAFTSIICISGMVAQDSKEASGPERVRVVNIPQKGAPPTGPDAVVIEQDQGLPADTVYRPSMLGSSSTRWWFGAKEAARRTA